MSKQSVRCVYTKVPSEGVSAKVSTHMMCRGERALIKLPEGRKPSITSHASFTFLTPHDNCWFPPTIETNNKQQTTTKTNKRYFVYLGCCLKEMQYIWDNLTLTQHHHHHHATVGLATWALGWLVWWLAVFWGHRYLPGQLTHPTLLCPARIPTGGEKWVSPVKTLVLS